MINHIIKLSQYIFNVLPVMCGSSVVVLVFLYITLCPFYFSIILKGTRTAGYFAIVVLQMYCYHKCTVALAHSAVGWSVVCDCGIS